MRGAEAVKWEVWTADVSADTLSLSFCHTRTHYVRTQRWQAASTHKKSFWVQRFKWKRMTASGQIALLLSGSFLLSSWSSIFLHLLPFLPPSSVPSPTPTPPPAPDFTRLPLNINGHSLRSATVSCKTHLCIHFNQHSKGENSLFILMCWENFNKDHSQNLHWLLYH